MKFFFSIINIIIVFSSMIKINTYTKETISIKFEKLIKNGTFCKILLDKRSLMQQNLDTDGYSDLIFDNIDKYIYDAFVERYGNLESNIIIKIEFLNPIEKNCIKEVLSSIFELFYENWILIKKEKESNIIFCIKQLILEENIIKKEFEKMFKDEKIYENHDLLYKINENFLMFPFVDNLSQDTNKNNSIYFQKNKNYDNNFSIISSELYKSISKAEFNVKSEIQIYKNDLFNCIRNYYNIIIKQLRLKVFKNSKTAFKIVKSLLNDTTIELKNDLHIFFNELEISFFKCLLDN